MLSKWKYKWVKLGEAQEGTLRSLQPFRPAMIRVDEYRICAVRLDDGIYGINNICPHAGAALHAGYCNKQGVVTCPLHDYKFDVRTGRSADGNNYQAFRFPFEERDDGWYVGVKKF